MVMQVPKQILTPETQNTNWHSVDYVSVVNGERRTCAWGGAFLCIMLVSTEMADTLCQPLSGSFLYHLECVIHYVEDFPVQIFLSSGCQPLKWS